MRKAFKYLAISLSIIFTSIFTLTPVFAADFNKSVVLAHKHDNPNWKAKKHWDHGGCYWHHGKKYCPHKSQCYWQHGKKYCRSDCFWRHGIKYCPTWSK